MGSWLKANVDKTTLRKLDLSDDGSVDQTAEDIYEQHGSNHALLALLGCLSGRPPHHSKRPEQAAKLRSVHLSGLRMALREMSTGGQKVVMA